MNDVMEIMVSVSEWLDMYLYAITVFAGMGLFTSEDNTDAPNLTKYKGFAKKLADYGVDDRLLYKLATVLKNFLMQVIPERVRKVVAGECNPRVMDNLESRDARQAVSRPGGSVRRYRWHGQHHRVDGAHSSHRRVGRQTSCQNGGIDIFRQRY